MRMPVYRVRFIAEMTYEALVSAPDEETARGAAAYALAVEMPAEHHWRDSEVLGEVEGEEADIDVSVVARRNDNA
jgi:hypothetical protein